MFFFDQIDFLTTFAFLGWIEKNKADELFEPQIAGLTLKCLSECVPSCVPGIVFLSGGQTEKEAAERLCAINMIAKELGKRKVPWLLSFSYGRALQNSAVDAWKGEDNNLEEAQKKFIAQAEKCSKAVRGALKD